MPGDWGRHAPRSGDAGARPRCLVLRHHLGSTALTGGSGGSLVAELRDKAWGETRDTSGATPAAYRFTGQREGRKIFRPYSVPAIGLTTGRKTKDE